MQLLFDNLVSVAGPDLSDVRNNPNSKRLYRAIPPEWSGQNGVHQHFLTEFLSYIKLEASAYVRDMTINN